MARHLVNVATILLYCCAVVSSAVYNPSGGPVYVSPQQSVAAPVQASASEALLTQTVYGFLDFTTTIGNTVMVFSPQSAPADGGKTTPKPETTTTSVIETKPPTSPPEEIKPSKTEAPPKTDEKKATLEEKASKKSLVQVKSSSPTTSPVVLSSVVEVRGGPQDQSPVISSQVEVREGSSSATVSTMVEVKVAPSSVVNVVERLPEPIVNVKVSGPKPEGVPKPLAILSSKVEVVASSDEPAISGNNVDGPAEYDFLSRQPSEVVDETYRVIDLRPTLKHGHKNNKPRPSKATPADVHPTGLVTSMGGTVVKDGLTTVHETSVLGTYISGKYAQVLQSTSHIYQSQKKPKPTPVQQTKILKTTAPSLKAGRPSLEPTPVGTLQEDSALPLEALFNSPSGGNLIRTSRRPAVGALPFKNRFQGRSKGGKEEQELEPEPVEEATPQPSYKKNRNRDRQQNQRNSFKSNRFGRPSQPELATVSVYSEPVTPANNRKYQSASNRRNGFRPGKGDNSVDSNTRDRERERDSRRNFKPAKAAPSQDQSTSLYKFKLSRPTGRWQYKTTPKPRVTIRRTDEGVDNTTATEAKPEDQEQQGSDVTDSRDLDNDVVAPTETSLPLETIKVEISTPAEFRNTYYEIATIKSPYTFQVQFAKISHASTSDALLVSQLTTKTWERVVALQHLTAPIPNSQVHELVEEFVRQRVPVYAESEVCQAHSELLVDCIIRGEMWALRMFDASSKLPSGVLERNIDLGNYHECIRSIEPNQMFVGQHCVVETRGILPPELHDQINLDISQVPPEYEVEKWTLRKDIMFSMCVPSTCSPQDVRVHMDHVLAPINASTLLYDSSCSTAQPLPFTSMDYVAVAIFLGILVLALWSTITDIYSSKPKSVVVVAFSLVRNWQHLTSIKAASSGDIPCIHGLRVLMILCVVFAHTTTSEGLMVVTTFSVSSILDTWTVALAETSLRAVDVFFMIGGTVRAYGFLQDRYKGKRLDVLQSIMRRYMRYTPTLAVVMLYTATLMSHLGSGPLWGRLMDYPKTTCCKFWFLNVFLIQNYITTFFSCVGESWYLAADFHMFIFSLLILIPLYFRPKFGLSLLVLTFVVSMVFYVFTCYTMEIEATCNSIYYIRVNEFLQGSYFKSHFRLPMYLLGLVLGYLLFTVERTKKRIKIHKMVIRIGWTLSIVIPVLLLVLNKIILAPDYKYNPWIDIPVQVFGKFLISAIGAWVVFVCTMGYGGEVNNFLTWKGFQPLSKLVLGVYLVNLNLTTLVVARRTTLHDIDPQTIVVQWLGNIVLATVVAVPLCLLVELPCYKLASHYLTTPVPYDPITETINFKKLQHENHSTSEQHKSPVPYPSGDIMPRKVKKKRK